MFIEADKSKEAKEKALSGNGNAIEKEVVAICFPEISAEKHIHMSMAAHTDSKTAKTRLHRALT